MKNLYETLGVKTDATDVEIKKAYKHLAGKHHPDRNQDNPKSKAAFQAIQEAYSTLMDAAKRKKYDETGSIDEGPTKTDMACKMILELVMHHFKKSQFRKKDYLKIVKGNLDSSLIECNNDIEKVIAAINNFEYLCKNMSSKGKLDDLLELEMVKLKHQKAFCENGKEIIQEGLTILSKDCEYTGEGEGDDIKTDQEQLADMFRAHLGGTTA